MILKLRDYKKYYKVRYFKMMLFFIYGFEFHEIIDGLPKISKRLQKSKLHNFAISNGLKSYDYLRVN
jgi:hypothetical protein